MSQDFEEEEDSSMNEITLPYEAQKTYEELFNNLDVDHTGTLNKNEFKKFLQLANIPKSRAKYIFEIVDTDNSGEISYDEYEKFVTRCYLLMNKGMIKEYVRMWFDACDKDKDGALNMDEFVHFIKCCAGKINVLNRKKQFKEWDSDGNGKIDFDEIMSKIIFKIQKKELTL